MGKDDPSNGPRWVDDETQQRQQQGSEEGPSLPGMPRLVPTGRSSSPTAFSTPLIGSGVPNSPASVVDLGRTLVLAPSVHSSERTPLAPNQATQTASPLSPLAAAAVSATGVLESASVHSGDGGGVSLPLSPQLQPKSKKSPPANPFLTALEEMSRDGSGDGAHQAGAPMSSQPTITVGTPGTMTVGTRSFADGATTPRAACSGRSKSVNGAAGTAAAAACGGASASAAQQGDDLEGDEDEITRYSGYDLVSDPWSSFGSSVDGEDEEDMKEEMSPLEKPDIKPPEKERMSTCTDMDAILRESAHFSGIRLRWVLLIVFVVVVIVVVLFFVEFRLYTNRHLKTSERSAVFSKAAKVQGNTVSLIVEMMTTFYSIQSASDFSPALLRDVCTRITSAPSIFGQFNRTDGSLITEWPCPVNPHISFSSYMPAILNATNVMQIVDYSPEYALAFQILYNQSGTLIDTDEELDANYGYIYAALLKKSVVGRVLLSNDIPEYSDAVLRSTTEGFITRTSESTSLTNRTVLLHTLTRDVPTYTEVSPKINQLLIADFQKSCEKRKVWNTVVHFDENFAVERSFNAIPEPQLRYTSFFGLLSSVKLCSVLCIRDSDESFRDEAVLCENDDPSNIYFIVHLDEDDPDGGVRIMFIIGVTTVVLMAVLIVLMYFSVVIPVWFMRFQLFHIVGVRQTMSRWKRLFFRCTHGFWIGDIESMNKSLYILGICFNLNKKYVPEHILRHHTAQLAAVGKNYNLLDLLDSSGVRRDNAEENTSEDGGEGKLDDLFDLVNANPNGDDGSWAASGIGEPRSTAHDTGLSRSTNSEVRLAIPTSVSTRRGAAGGGGGLESSTGPNLSRSRQDEGDLLLVGSGAIAAEATPTNLDASGLDHRERSFNTIELDVGDGNNSSRLSVADVQNPSMMTNMMIKRVEDATLMVVKLNTIEAVYHANYRIASRQHRLIVNYLLSRIRHWGGAVYLRTGDCLAAAWNAFDLCANHAEMAVSCAMEVVNSFTVYRRAGLLVGVILHAGAFICGSLEGEKEAFATAFGTATREAVLIADLVVVQKDFGLVVSEPVKQAIASLYDSIIVDVVKGEHDVHPIILFEISPRRKIVAGDPVQLQANQHRFAIQYAKAFSHFLQHEYMDALNVLSAAQSLAPRKFKCHTARIQRLSRFLMAHPQVAPMPYCRYFPAWKRFESVTTRQDEETALRGTVSTLHGSSSSRHRKFVRRGTVEGTGGVEVPSSSAKASHPNSAKNRHRHHHRNDTTGGDRKDVVSLISEGSMTSNGERDNPSVARRLLSLRHQLTSIRTQPDGEEDGILNFRRELQDNLRRAGGGQSTEVLSTPNTFPVLSPCTPTNNNVSFNTDRGQGVGNAGDGGKVKTPSVLSDPANPPPPTETVGNESSGTPLSPGLIPILITPTTASSSAIPLLSSGSGGGGIARPVATFVVPGEERPTEDDQPLQLRSPCGPSTCFPLIPDLEATLVKVSSSPHDGLDDEEKVGAMDAATSATGNGTAANEDETPNISTLNNHNAAIMGSIIQSVGLTLPNGMISPNTSDSGGNGKTPLPRSPAASSPDHSTIPVDIVAKNGIRYQRSERVLGSGSFGSVFLGMDVCSGRLVAIKVIPLPTSREEADMNSMEAEVFIMRLKDPHVVEFISYAFQPQSMAIIMECMLAGSLQNMLTSFKSLPSDTAKAFIRDVLRGLQKLHSMGVVHRDVKPQNVLLTPAGRCKITDFGTSAELTKMVTGSSVHGTPVYLSPEAARGSPVAVSDIWSCGIMYIQLVTGHLPYHPEKLQLPVEVLVYQIGSGLAMPVIPDTLDELELEFAQACLQVQPESRKSAERLLQSPMFAL